MRSQRMFALGGCLLLSLAGVVRAESADTAALNARIAELEAKQAQMTSQLSEMKSQQDSNWLNERRAEEVKALVSEVLQDADLRASLQGGGLNAGHNGSRFFLASEDGSFLLQIGGRIQIRYIANFQEEDSSDEDDPQNEDDESGFTLRRVNLYFDGHIGSPKIGYSVGLQIDRDDQDVLLDHAIVSYEFMDGLLVWGGEQKDPFLREEMISASRQLAVERSLVNEVFTAGRVQGIGVVWDATDAIKVSATFTDGLRSGEAEGAGLDAEDSKDFDGDQTDLAVTGRIDIRLAGDWAQWKDYSAWEGEELALFIGGAAHYESFDNEGGIFLVDESFEVSDIWTATVDAAAEFSGFNASAAAMIQNINADVDDDDDDFRSYGFVAQAGYMVIPDTLEPFVRWEWLDVATFDSDSEADTITLWTAGVNYYLKKHEAKFSFDVVWCPDPITSANVMGNSIGGLGLLEDSELEENQVAFRAQFQLLF